VNYQAFTNDSLTMMYEGIRGALAADEALTGDIWNVHDGNSGGHVTREHPRSIADYIIEPEFLIV
jgi:hypothetical protein